MIIIDIGACVGEFTDFCLASHPVEAIYLFEPLSVNYNFLAKKYANNEKIKLYHMAVSDFDGVAKFYKKQYKKDGKPLFDFPGNAGSSLRRDKGSTSKKHFENVKVIKLSTFVKAQKINKIDILKVDVEGSEYAIFDDMINHHLYENIGKIYYEDHSRKVAGIIDAKNAFFAKASDLGILHKFYTQSGLLDYKPLRTCDENI
jgi:FkbM family methyltransferase